MDDPSPPPAEEPLFLSALPPGAPLPTHVNMGGRRLTDLYGVLLGESLDDALDRIDIVKKVDVGC